MNYVKKTRQVLTLAVRKEWIEKNPLSDFRCTYRDPNRSYLSLTEVHDLSNAEMPSKRLDEVRDVYLFSCYTGYAYKELKNLSPQNIIIGIDGKKWLTIERSKTEGMETLPLLPVPLYLLEKYKDHPYCQVNNVILPVKSNQKYNEYIKEVARAAGIKKSLTSHTARHTFATTMTLEHDVPLETVSKILGHRSLKTTQIYAKITTRKLSNNMKGT